MIRRYYTLLDFLAELSLLDDAIKFAISE